MERDRGATKPGARVAARRCRSHLVRRAFDCRQPLPPPVLCAPLWLERSDHRSHQPGGAYGELHRRETCRYLSIIGRHANILSAASRAHSSQRLQNRAPRHRPRSMPPKQTSRLHGDARQNARDSAWTDAANHAGGLAWKTRRWYRGRGHGVAQICPEANDSYRGDRGGVSSGTRRKVGFLLPGSA